YSGVPCASGRQCARLRHTRSWGILPTPGAAVGACIWSYRPVNTVVPGSVKSNSTLSCGVTGKMRINAQAARLLDELGGLINRDTLIAAHLKPTGHKSSATADIEDAQRWLPNVGEDKRHRFICDQINRTHGPPCRPGTRVDSRITSRIILPRYPDSTL